MKVNSVANATYSGPSKTNKNTSQTNFKARVNVLNDIKDSISGDFVRIDSGVLKNLVDRIVPELRKFDDNLIFNLSGTKKKKGFFDLFTNDIYGLKMDVRYFDEKKAYYDILSKRPEDQKLKRDTYEAIRKRDNSLMRMFSERIGIGKFFRPNTENEEHFTEFLLRMVKSEIKSMPHRLFEGKNVTKEADGTYAVYHNPSWWKGEDLRQPWAYYRGIEY